MLLFWDFSSLFFDVGINQYTFPLRNAFAASHKFGMFYFHFHLPEGIFKLSFAFFIDPLVFQKRVI